MNDPLQARFVELLLVSVIISILSQSSLVMTLFRTLSFNSVMVGVLGFGESSGVGKTFHLNIFLEKVNLAITFFSKISFIYLKEI